MTLRDPNNDSTFSGGGDDEGSALSDYHSLVLVTIEGTVGGSTKLVGSSSSLPHLIPSQHHQHTFVIIRWASYIINGQIRPACMGHVGSSSGTPYPLQIRVSNVAVVIQAGSEGISIRG
ncbi:hypothetical protein Tco_1466790 [Tanacetum coccineum]